MRGPFESHSSGQSALHTAETEIATATERARQDLSQTREELGELERMLTPLAQTTATFASVANQLSNMVITAAGEITRSGPAGRPFMPFIEQLAEITRASMTALQDLQRHSGDSRARLRTLLAVTEQSRAALDRIGPAVSALADAAAQATRTHGPAIEVVVRAPASATEKANRVAQLTEEVLRERERRASDPKN